MRTPTLHLGLALITLLAPAAVSTADTRPEGGCFSIVVGKNVSNDGSVIMAHNEDDYIPQVVNHHKIPRQSHPLDAFVLLDNGVAIPQVPETWAYIWSEMPGMLFSDSYLNEQGVCVCSDACRSREDQPELIGGGITHMLRQLIAERATSARHGVQIAGDLVSRFGYGASGRTYIISDPNEGWLFCAVNGKRWVAQRVPDDEVALIANTYIVHEVDLSDTLNYLGSPDLIDYAITRGWYDPAADGPFDFAQVYADSTTAADPRNIGRQWDAVRRIAADPPAYGDPLPFSVAPKEKLRVAGIMQLLRSHYEETELHGLDSSTGCPHTNHTLPICRHDTQTSFIAQLRGNLPPEIGLVYWVALSSPCVSCYIPFHFGLDAFPTAYTGPSVQPTDTIYKKQVAKPFAVDTTNAFWTFTMLRHHVEQSYAELAPMLRARFDTIETTAATHLPEIDSAAAEKFKTDYSGAMRILSDYSLDIYSAAIGVLKTLK